MEKHEENASGAVRRNVSIPADLERRMRECSDAHKVNWSQVAARAFEEELRYFEIRTKGDGKMSSTVERWKRDFEEDQKAGREQGFTDGREWAAETATFKEARRVAALRGRVLDDTPDAIWRAACPEDNLAHHEFWEQVTGPDYETDVDDAYAEGFLKGVGEVFDALSDQVVG
jgi:hypothetical protein